MRQRKFTEAVEREIARQYASGDSSGVLSKRWGATAATILVAIRHQGGTAREQAIANAMGLAHLKSLTPAKERQVAERYIGGEPSTHLAKRFGVSKRLILRTLRRAGIVRRSSIPSAEYMLNMQQERRLLTDEQEAEAGSDHVAGKPMSAIAKAFDVSVSVIHDGLTRQGTMMRRCTRRHTLNEAAFDDCEHNPDAAYWCGFLMADGCISVRQRERHTAVAVMLALAEQDVQHIYDFRTFLGSNHKIHRRPPKRAPHQGMNGLCVDSKRLADALAKYGVVPRKSHIAKVFHLERSRDFWRGAVCGDGWVWFKDRPTIGLCGSYFLVQQFLDFVKTVTDTRAHVCRSKNIARIQFSCGVAAAIAHALFDGCTTALARKLETAKRIMAWKPKRPQKKSAAH